MNAGLPLAVLDACVLANFALCDTLLRLAEPPALYEPRWSEQIIRETARTLLIKLRWPPALVGHMESELRAHFREAWIEGHDALIEAMPNDAKDRHVLAAAVHASAPIVVTFNLRDFKPADTTSWGVRAVHPDEFLIAMYHQSPSLVLSKLEQQAADRNRDLTALLNILTATVPQFALLIAATR